MPYTLIVNPETPDSYTLHSLGAPCHQRHHHQRYEGPKAAIYTLNPDTTWNLISGWALSQIFSFGFGEPCRGVRSKCASGHRACEQPQPPPRDTTHS